MSKVIEAREPLTEQEVWEYLTKHVDSVEKQWGEDYIYSEWARHSREEKFAQWQNGEVVVVHVVAYVDKFGSGCGDYEDWLYSDGHVETVCYGSID